MLSNSDFVALTHPAISWQQETPVAEQFADPYFSRDGGVAETDYVFIDGNDLTRRFRNLDAGTDFVIGETGFGSGLNFYRAVACFLEHAADDCVLHYISTERHPLHASDLLRACRQFPASPVMQELTQRWPAATPGFHQRTLAAGRIRLLLLFGDSTAMLGYLHGEVQAWFLDGFAPARNHSMWQADLYAALARCSAPGATLATFTAAGHVRRGLAEQGFIVERVPGFARKRHMLRASRPAAANTAATSCHRRPTVAIIGAGLAGCSSARALADAGCQVVLFDPAGIAAGASGNLAGVLHSSASAHMTAQNRFYMSSYLHSLDWLARLCYPTEADQGALSGVIQLAKDERARSKASAALASGIWPTSELCRLANNTDMHKDNATDNHATLHFLRAGYLSPGAWCNHLIQHPLITLQSVAVSALANRRGWQLFDAGQRILAQVDKVVLANAAAALPLAGINLPLKSIRGQVSHVQATAASRHWRQAVCHHGYLTPAIAGQHCVGATFDQHDNDPMPRPEDDQRNLAQLRNALPAHWQALGGEQARVVGQRVGFRCQSTDFLPIVGPLTGQPGLYLNIAHGSRGLTGTPLAADLLCAQILDWPLPTDSGIVAALATDRFARRQGGKNSF